MQVGPNKVREQRMKKKKGGEGAGRIEVKGTASDQPEWVAKGRRLRGGDGKKGGSIGS